MSEINKVLKMEFLWTCDDTMSISLADKPYIFTEFNYLFPSSGDAYYYPQITHDNELWAEIRYLKVVTRACKPKKLLSQKKSKLDFDL